MGSSSAGVACILAASQPQRFLLPAEQQRDELQRLQQMYGQESPELERRVLALVLPSRELEFDMRGRLEVQPGTSAAIDVGECKSSVDYSGAVPQLGLRLGALRWLVCTCFDVPPEGVQLVGRLFVVGHADAAGTAGVDDAQQQRALDGWGYRLVLHRVM
jgi:hypothetical protein